MFIQTEITPNPVNMKFIPDMPLLDGGTASFQTAEDAREFSPLASALFEVESVKGVFLASSFLIVSKDDDADWAEMKPKIVGTLIEFLSSGRPVIDTEGVDKIKAEKNEEKEEVKRTLTAESIIAEKNSKPVTFIETEITPNPATLKFLAGVEIMSSGTANFKIQDDVKGISPLVDTLFEIQGVVGVFFGGDFITITKNDATNWTDLKTIVLSSLTQFFNNDTPFLFDGAELPKRKEKEFFGDEKAIVDQIKELLETRVRPAVAQDGGDIIFSDYDDGIVYLIMLGACGDCPSSTLTLKAGIENMLKYYIPEVIEVRSMRED